MEGIKYENRYKCDAALMSNFEKRVLSGELTNLQFLPPVDKINSDLFEIVMKIKDGASHNCNFVNLDLFTLRNEFTEFNHTGFGTISLFEITKAILLNLAKYNLSDKLKFEMGENKNQILIESVDSKHGALLLKAIKDIENQLLKNKQVYSRFYFRHKATQNKKEYIHAFSDYMETVYRDKLLADNLDEYSDFKEIYVGVLEMQYFSRFDAASTLEEVIEITQEYNINFNIFLLEIDAYFRAMYSEIFDVELSYPPIAFNIT